MNKLNKNLNFRLAKINDAKELLDIYKPYINETNITFEYDIPTIEEFTERIKKILMHFPYIVVEINNKIIGYAYANTFRSRAAYDWVVETSVYLSRDYHGRKIGEKLYEILEEILKLQNVTNLVASITYPNPQSIAFHEKTGYKKIAHFSKCGYKSGVWCDMIFMERFINEHTVPAKKIIYLPDLDKEKIDEIFAKHNNLGGCSIKQ